MASMIAGTVIKAAVKPIIKQIVKNGVKGLLSKAFKKKLIEKVKKAIMRKIRREARKDARDQVEDFMDECIEGVLNDTKEMSDIVDRVEQEMSDWLDREMKFNPWDLVPGVAEVRMIQQMTSILNGSGAESQSKKYFEEQVELRARLRANKSKINIERGRLSKLQSEKLSLKLKIIEDIKNTYIPNVNKCIAHKRKMIKSNTESIQQIQTVIIAKWEKLSPDKSGNFTKEILGLKDEKQMKKCFTRWGIKSMSKKHVMEGLKRYIHKESKEILEYKKEIREYIAKIAEYESDMLKIQMELRSTYA